MRPDDLACPMTMQEEEEARMARSIIATIAFAVAIWTNPVVAAPSSFDGAWSVNVVTDSGDCGRSYRYGVQIFNGRVVLSR